MEENVIKNILITGVHTGLGRGLAEVYLEKGASVTGLSRQPPDALQSHQRFTFHNVDLLQIASLEARLQSVFDAGTGYDLVLLNAGVLGGLKRLGSFSVEEIHTIMNINVWANKLLIDCLLGQSIPPGQIIAMSSGAAIYGSSGWGVYSISKAALNCLIRVCADEWPNCHFCTLAPGLVDTPMLQSIFDRPPNPEFPGDTQIHQAWDEGLVQSPIAAAERIASVADKLKTVQSGQYYDIRSLPFEPA
jgi:NAD(P)-dependent dehydrogenase (short-subunit alcohol dehydrogenase family)